MDFSVKESNSGQTRHYFAKSYREISSLMTQEGSNNRLNSKLKSHAFIAECCPKDGWSFSANSIQVPINQRVTIRKTLQSKSSKIRYPESHCRIIKFIPWKSSQLSLMKYEHVKSAQNSSWHKLDIFSDAEANLNEPVFIIIMCHAQTSYNCLCCKIS